MPQKTKEQIIEELDAHLQRVVKSHMIADVPVGAFLSGGVDSSSLVALAARYTQKPIRTFSVIFKDNPAVDESRFSDLVARKYNTQHTAEEMTTDFVESFEKIIWHADETIRCLFRICPVWNIRVGKPGSEGSVGR